MCGRFTQYRTAVEYLDALRYDKPIEGGIDPEPINRYNVAPRSRVMIFLRDRHRPAHGPLALGISAVLGRG